jgi:outer membrane immunogenic protein
MKKLLFAGLALIASSATAPCADLGTMPLKAPMAAPLGFNWGGAYFGAHIGWGWESHSTDSFSETTPGTLVFVDHTDFNSNGFFGGGQIGYNWLLTPNWLFGVEFDGSGSTASTNVTGCNASGCASSSVNTDAFGTGRGRVGYVMSNLLLYGTGGWAWVDSHTDRTITAAAAAPSLVGSTASASGFTNGWAAGGGLEWGFAPRWTAKIEYLHLQVDNISRDFIFSTITPLSMANRHNESSNSIDTVRIGVNFLFSQ